MKSDLNELKSSISEMKNLSTSQAFSRLRSSMDNLVDGENLGVDTGEPLVTFPPETPPCDNTTIMPGVAMVTKSFDAGAHDTVKYEHQASSSASTTKVVTDSFSAEKATANKMEMKSLQAGEVNFQEKTAAAAMKARVDMNGISAEKSQVQKQVSYF